MSRQPVRSVAAFRATRTLSIAIESDPDPMVQQQLARLRFLEHVVGVRGQKILDWGCGTGFNCRYLNRSSQASRVLGFDLSQEAIKLRRHRSRVSRFWWVMPATPPSKLTPDLGSDHLLRGS